MKSDLEIAYENEMKPIREIVSNLGIDEENIELYGKYKAKLDLSLYEESKNKKDGKLILVTAISPTKAGEGKSTTTIGLADSLNKVGKKAIVCVREPSFGPVLGLKGGACGGGYAQVQPMDDINMHFTGDFHAITSANNAISALLDNSLHNGNPLNIDFDRITWKRCLDMNDRSLRVVDIGLGAKVNGPVRRDGFDITVASEIMAVLCLATSVEDLRARIARIIVAYNTDGAPVTVDDLGATGCATLILKDAIKPNLVQTLEHNPALIHGGPFANIAHGCNSVLATKLGLKLCDYVVTEAGFGADLGAEKFLDIKCRLAGLNPNAVVIVATIRALKMHGEALDYTVPDLEALKKGICNLERHIDTVKLFGLPYVVAINRFGSDTDEEVEFLESWAKENGHTVSLSEVFAKGSEGGIDLANKVIEACDMPNTYKPIYDVNSSIEDKINTIVTKVYGGDGVNYSETALDNIKELTKLGYDKLPICMAKTPSSLTDDAKIVGRPTGFKINVSGVKVSAGAGFIVVYTGSIMTMPGLPKEPNALRMDYVDGQCKGLF